MSPWPLVPIEQVAEIFDGPHATPKTVASGPIFLGISALQQGRIDLGETRHVSPDDFKKWTRRVKPQPNDVVFSYETRIGEAAIIPNGLECCLGRRMGLVRTDPRFLDPRYFLYAYLSPSFQEFLRSRTVTGATVDRIALKEFPKFPIPLPELSEQRAIAAVLGALDDKIDLNRRMNETLEAMARALFKDWFVDFGPTRAKMEGRAPYLAPDLWALFPDRLDDEGKPEGWENRRVHDLMELGYGKSLPANARLPGSCPVYGSGGIAGFHSTGLLSAPSVIVGRKGTVGSLYWEDRPCFPIDTVFYVIPNNVPLTFCFYLLGGLGLSNMNTDAAVPGLNRNNVYRLSGPWGAKAVTDVFDDIVRPIRNRIFANDEESRVLAATRDLLLPKLMSGEIRVRDAEKMVEPAL